ncbi:MAG: hypothetical protein NVV72_16535 [Asticcacaulis sp.]|nr:hypothetical protein [Asticcacaulis sp.]
MTFRPSTKIISLPFSTDRISWQGFDLDDNGNWIAIIESDEGLRLLTDHVNFPMPVDLPYAMVRWIGDNALVVISRIVEVGEINAWVIDPKGGEILNAFSVGDGVKDVLVLKNFIAVSYFDEGIFGSPQGLSIEGLCILSHDGAYLWGYTSSVSNAVDIGDCYAMCPLGPNRLAFCAYSHFEWVELDLESHTQKVVPTPQQLHGSGAITCRGDTAFFVGPYPDNQDFSKPRDEVFAFNRVTGTVSKAPSISGKALRGMSDGRLLSMCDEGLLIATFI